MLKTIKTKKQMRLDELIKHVWDNGIKSKQELITYKSKLNTVVTIDMSGQIAVYGAHFGNETYTVEVEEPITEDTVFETLVEIQKDEQVNLWFDTNIVTYRNAGTSKFYALINGKLELVYEREDKNV